MAWGGHIASRVDWGCSDGPDAQLAASAARTSTCDSSIWSSITSIETIGNQDRSFSAQAIVVPGSITIIKDVNPEPDATDFSFTTTGTGLSNFSLDDDGVNRAPADIKNTRPSAAWPRW